MQQDSSLTLSRYLVYCEEDGASTLWSTRTGRMVDITRDELDLLRAADARSLAPHLVERLRAARMLVPEESDELSEVLAENEEWARNDADIDLVLVPSSDCPLGCNLAEFGGYCGQSHTKNKMAEDVADDVVALVRRSCRRHHQNLKVTWFGGEPLLALGRMRHLSRSLRDTAEDLDLVYRSALVTGGTLFTEVVARECHLALGIGAVSITLDGLAEQHDTRRGTKGGRGSFDRIVRNLDEIIAQPDLDRLAIAVRCNIDRRNIAKAGELIGFIAARGWQKRIDLYPAPVHPWGTAARQDAILSAREFAALELEWHQALRDAGFRSRPMPRRKPLVCRVVSTSRVVVGHDGSVHRCTESPLTPINDKRDNLGAVSGWDTLDAIPTWSWHEDLAAGRYPCSRCEYLPICGGACPMSWRTASDVPCPPFKHNGVDRLRRHNAVTAKFMNPAAAPLQHSPYSIFGMWIGMTPDPHAVAMVEALDREMSSLRREVPSQRCKEVADRLVRQAPSHSTDGRAQRLEIAARLATAAYLYYRCGSMEGIAGATERIVEVLHFAAKAGVLDPRLAQVQALLNLIGAEFKLYSAIDVSLAESLADYLAGRHSLRIAGAYLRRLDADDFPRQIVEGLARDLEEILGLAGAKGCA